MLQNEIRSMDEYQAQTEKTAEAQASQSNEAATLADALAPVLNWEKSDAEFWLQVAQLLVLLAILYNVRGTPRGAY